MSRARWYAVALWLGPALPLPSEARPPPLRGGSNLFPVGYSLRAS